MANLPTPADLARIALRQEKALELRLLGRDLASIGRELGVSREQARKDIKAVLEATAEHAAEMAEQIRAIELARLDKAREKAFAVLATAGEDPELELKAIDRIIKLSERTAKLVGADAPERIDATLTEGPTPEAAARLVRETFRTEDTHESGSNGGVGPKPTEGPADRDG